MNTTHIQLAVIYHLNVPNILTNASYLEEKVLVRFATKKLFHNIALILCYPGLTLLHRHAVKNV